MTLTGPQLGALWEEAVAAQIARSNALRHRAQLGHPAGVLLGAYPAGGAWGRPSAIYLVGALELPWTAPSLPWAQLEAWRIAPDCDWWEALGAPTQMMEE
jgi:hypothetical protein